MEPIKVNKYQEYIRKHRRFTGCLIDKDNDIYWFKNGKFHREDGPAVEWTDGSKFWYKNGLLHREDGPAIEYTDGDKAWRLNGEHFYTEQDWLITTRKIKLERVLKRLDNEK